MWALRRAFIHVRNRCLSLESTRICAVKSEIESFYLKKYNAEFSQSQLKRGLHHRTSSSKSFSTSNIVSSSIGGKSSGDDNGVLEDHSSQHETRHDVESISESDHYVDEEVQNELEVLEGDGDVGEKKSPKTEAVTGLTKVLVSSAAYEAGKFLDKWVEAGNEVTRAEVSSTMLFLRSHRLFAKAWKAAPASTPPPAANLHTKSSLNEDELKKFAAISETWWDAEGPFKPLHVMNPTRLAFIRSTLCRHFGKDPCCSRPFEGLKFVDVGCGGGILSEPLARMGASVTGVDAVEKNIKIAQLHADLDPATSSIDYLCTTAKKLVEEQKKFDALLALEVIEHVADPADFCKSLSALTKSGGATLISTINRSMRAYATAIVVAEYVLRWLPAGTHEWSSFLTPEELVLILQRSSISVKEMAGFVYNPLTGRWYLSDDVGVNFIAYGTKNE